MPKPGILRLDDRAFVAVVRYGDIIVWHCAFADRCPRADELSWTEVPPLHPVRPDHFVACFHPGPR